MLNCREKFKFSWQLFPKLPDIFDLTMVKNRCDMFDLTMVKSRTAETCLIWRWSRTAMKFSCRLDRRWFLNHYRCSLTVILNHHENPFLLYWMDNIFKRMNLMVLSCIVFSLLLRIGWDKGDLRSNRWPSVDQIHRCVDYICPELLG